MSQYIIYYLQAMPLLIIHRSIYRPTFSRTIAYSLSIQVNFLSPWILSGISQEQVPSPSLQHPGSLHGRQALDLATCILAADVGFLIVSMLLCRTLISHIAGLQWSRWWPYSWWAREGLQKGQWSLACGIGLWRVV